MASVEFKTSEHSKDIKTNYNRLLRDCSEKTISGYLDVFLKMIKSGRKLVDSDSSSSASLVLNAVIKDIETKRSEGLLKSASYRRYKASLLCGITFLHKSVTDPEAVSNIAYDNIAALLSIRSTLTLNTLENEYKRVLGWVRELGGECARLDNIAHKKSRTSTTKEKSFDDFLYRRIEETTIRSKQLPYLRLFVHFNLKYGLRPIEWHSADIIVEKDLPETNVDAISRIFIEKGAITTCDYPSFWLKVKNAKSSHDRSCGEYRYIAIGANIEELKPLKKFIDHLPKGLTEDEFDRKVLRRWQRCLSYIMSNDEDCVKFLDRRYKKQLRQYKSTQTLHNKKKTRPPVRQVPTLYSTRHQAIADAKSAGLDVISIAALFGHISIATAHRHYADRRKGRGSYSILPHVSNVATVIQNLRPDAVQNIAKENNITLPTTVVSTGFYMD